MKFIYIPGQQFSFTGGDDVFVFVDGQIVCSIVGFSGPTSCPGNPVSMDGKLLRFLTHSQFS